MNLKRAQRLRSQSRCLQILQVAYTCRAARRKERRACLTYVHDSTPWVHLWQCFVVRVFGRFLLLLYACTDVSRCECVLVSMSVDRYRYGYMPSESTGDPEAFSLSLPRLVATTALRRQSGRGRFSSLELAQKVDGKRSST